MTPLRLLLLWLLVCVSPAADAQSLYAQSIQAALARSTAGREVLVLDLRRGEILGDTFTPHTSAIPVGSLLKPFLALAYAATHSAPLPTEVCHGLPDRCWKPAGHGTMTLVSALANSCNAYFLQLARDLEPGSIPYLPAPPQHASPATLIGLTPEWRIAPEALARAYAALLAAPSSAVQDQVLKGMRGSATYGTAARIGVHPGGVLAKTGTAPCVDGPCAIDGDGLVLAAAPASHPTVLVLLRQRGTNGAVAAAAAGRVLTRLESLHAE